MRERGKPKLLYYIPNRNKAKTILRIPETHSLHICPLACGRRNAIRALQNGEREYMSFLFVTEDDAVSGEYVENIGAAIEELLEILEPVPRAFVLYFNCIDDFLGTDEKALIRELKRRFPFLYFTVCRINPVAAGEEATQGTRKHFLMYELLEHTEEKDDGINLIGNYVSLDENSELFFALSFWGVSQVRQLFECHTFSEYQAMAGSCLNLVLMPMGMLAARDMEERLDIPYYFNPPAYEMNEILYNYQSMAKLLGKPCPDLRQEIAETEQVIKEIRAEIGDFPVIIDSSASMRPFALAKALWDYGFHVTTVFAPHSKKDDLEDAEWLAERCPQINIVQREGVKAVTGYGLDSRCIAIGYDCAFLLKADHFVNMFNDETFYGFHGIRKLMHLISEAFTAKMTWEGR